MYEKNGEKYFVVDTHMHFWDASPANWVAGHEQYAKGWIECFHAYMGLGPPETHWPLEKFYKIDEDTLMRDVFEDGYVDVAIFQPTYLTEWYREGFNTTEQDGALSEKHPGKFIVNTRFDPRDGRRRPEGARGERRPLGLKRRQALHRGVAGRLARLHAEGPGGLRLPGEGPAARHQEHPRAQGPDDLAAGQGCVRRLRRRPCRDRFPRAELHRRARGSAAHRGLLLHGHAGTQRVRGAGGGHRCTDARPAEVLREGDGRAVVLGRRGQDDVRQRLQHLGAQVAGGAVRGLGLPRQ